MAYQYLPNGYIKRLADGAVIPPEQYNADYRAVLEWVEEGNFILPVDEDLVKALEAEAIAMAREANIASGVLYDSLPWATDAFAFRNLMAVLTCHSVGVPLPPQIPWRDLNDVTHMVTVDYLKGLAGAMLTKSLTEYQQAWTLKDQL